MTTADEVVAYLESLGATPDAVYESLKTLGIKGSHGVYGCPLAVALFRTFPELNRTDYPRYSVVGPYIRRTDGWFFSDTRNWVRLPEACDRFLLAYDRGEAYQDLDVNHGQFANA